MYNLDKSILALYLKYGIISTPKNKSFFLNKNNQSYKYLKLNRSYKSTINDIDKELEKIINNKIQKSIKNKTKVVLLMSAGNDSRLMYHYIFKICKDNKYLKNFFVVTGNFKNFKNKYSDKSFIKKNRNFKIHNHKYIHIDDKPHEYNKFIKLIKKLIKVNIFPINGLRYYLIYECIKYVTKKYKNHIIFTGIGDSIFNKYVNADKIAKNKSNYLIKKFNKLADEEYFKLKKPIFFHQKNKIDKLIHERHFFLMGPKTKYEFDQLGNFFSANMYHPFFEKKMLELCLNFEYKHINDSFNKYIIVKLLEKKELKIIDFNYEVDTPQREFIYKFFKNNNIFLDKSKLINHKIVDKSKIKKIISDYEINFNKLINTKNDNLLNSYSLWKFFVSELFFSLNLK